MLYEPVKGVRLQLDAAEDDLSDTDHMLIQTMADFEPLTDFKNGDLCMVTRLRKDLRERFKGPGIPRIWKVQFVASRAQLMLYKGSMSAGRAGIIGIDDVIEGMNQSVYNGYATEEAWLSSYVYAHGFPHGMHPNTASWFEESSLRRVMLQTLDVDWEPVLDEFKTAYMGYALPEFTDVAMDLAPDMYALGLNLDRPLSHEEETFHAGSLLGIEEDMAVPAEVEDIPVNGEWSALDPEHDVLT